MFFLHCLSLCSVLRDNPLKQLPAHLRGHRGLPPPQQHLLPRRLEGIVLGVVNHICEGGIPSPPAHDKPACVEPPMTTGVQCGQITKPAQPK